MGVDFYSTLGGTIDRGAEGAEVERRRHENRGAEPEGVGVGPVEKGFPPPYWEGSGEGVVPLPRKFFDCGSQNGEF